MGASTPDSRYYKDAYGLRPRWRLLFHAPGWYLWLMQPQWLLLWRIRRRDRRYLGWRAAGERIAAKADRDEQ